MDGAIADDAQQLLESLAHSLYVDTKKDGPRFLAAAKQFRRGFEGRLQRRWMKAIDLFDLTAQLALDAGSNFNGSHRPQASADTDFVFEALCRLHARACLTTSEVRALLVSGHATGAMARWRTLHELAVVAFFIKERGGDVAERYLLHAAIESAKAGEEYQDSAVDLGNDPLTDEELASLRRRKDDLIKRFGAPFGEQYGWAASSLSNKRPNFSEIEQAVQLQHARGYYRMASLGVHSSARGSYADLGQSQNSPMRPMELTAGPSNAGLADPAIRTLFSLFQCTILFLGTRPDILTVTVSLALSRLYEEATDEFLKAHYKLGEDEAGVFNEERAQDKTRQARAKSDKGR